MGIVAVQRNSWSLSRRISFVGVLSGPSCLAAYIPPVSGDKAEIGGSACALQGSHPAWPIAWPYSLVLTLQPGPRVAKLVTVVEGCFRSLT
jgi:hypothetical protein